MVPVSGPGLTHVHPNRESRLLQTVNSEQSARQHIERKINIGSLTQKIEDAK